MKVQCKCGEVLTKDLYPTKNWSQYTENVGDEDNTFYRNRLFIRPGTFIYTKSKSYWENRPLFRVAREDIIDQSQLLNRKGVGCCDLSWVEFHCPGCKTHVGDINLDCYQDRRIDLFDRKVTRLYGSRR